MQHTISLQLLNIPETGPKNPCGLTNQPFKPVYVPKLPTFPLFSGPQIREFFLKYEYSELVNPNTCCRGVY